MLRNRTDQEQPHITRRQMLMIMLAALVIVYLIWNVTFLEPLAYPFRLFVTYVHEAGHSIAAVLTGGEIVGFTISPDGSGLATTRGGIRAIILPAGYIGAALFGAALFYLLNTRPYARTTAIILGIGLVLFTLLYARPDESGNLTALMVGVLGGVALIGMGWRLNWEINLLVLNVLAMMTALNAVLDAFLLIRYTDATRGMVRNDAAAFSAEVIGLPAAFWALLWALIALGLVGAAVYYSLLRPMLRNNRSD